jgi:hypothetical protein
MFGVLLLQVGILFGAIGFIIEEKFMSRKPDLDPILIVGCEGSYASLMWILLLAAFQFIPCQSEHFCTNGHLEDTHGAFQDYIANPMLIL